MLGIRGGGARGGGGKQEADRTEILGNFTLAQGSEGAKPLIGQTSPVAPLLSAGCS